MLEVKDPAPASRLCVVVLTTFIACKHSVGTLSLAANACDVNS